MKKSRHIQKLHNKTIVITGASSGVGRAAALAFAKEKAILILVARRGNALEELAEECQTHGAKVNIVTSDVTHAEEMKILAQKALDFSGKIDVWINNAGVLAAGEFDATPIDVHHRVIQTNLLGYMNGAHAALPVFKKQGCGILINNISVGAWFPTPYATAYTASKFGIAGFSESLKAELIKWPDIHVCDMFPAFLDTPGMQHAANFTGKVLMPAPPVFDANRVAKAMVQLAKYPKETTTTDMFAPLIKASYSLFPSLTRFITAKVIEKYFQSADKIPLTAGNLFVPLKYGASTSGGWQHRIQHKVLPKSSSVVIAALATIGFFILKKGLNNKAISS